MKIVDKLKSLQGNATFDTVSKMLLTINKSITIKRFNDSDELFLVHNDYNKKNNDTLYRECRSFVMAIKDGNAKIVSYSHETIIEEEPEGNAKMYETFEGTMISMFFYDKWYFVTSRCTDIDKSFFYNSQVTFGNMLDDCLRNMNMNRESFTSQFETFDHMYSFVIVHHQNKYIKDYTEQFGENYAKLVLVIERENNTLHPCHLSEIEHVIRPRLITDDSADCVLYQVYDEARHTIRYYKKMSEKYRLAVKRKPNFSNVWYSYIQIFRDNDKNYTIDMYRKENNINDNNKFNITGMIHLLYKESASLLLQLVSHFTEFRGDAFIKVNCDDYNEMDNYIYSGVKKQIATIQVLWRNGTIYDSNSVLTYLRKHVSVQQFVHLLKGIRALDKFDFFEIKNKYYKNYLHFLIKQLNS